MVCIAWIGWTKLLYFCRDKLMAFLGIIMRTTAVIEKEDAKVGNKKTRQGASGAWKDGCCS